MASAPNVAVHVFTPSTVTVVVAPVPEQLPPQDANECVASGVAVSVTGVDDGNVTEQAAPPAPQVIPPPVTVPPDGGVTFN